MLLPEPVPAAKSRAGIYWQHWQHPGDGYGNGRYRQGSISTTALLRGGSGSDAGGWPSGRVSELATGQRLVYLLQDKPVCCWRVPLLLSWLGNFAPGLAARGADRAGRDLSRANRRPAIHRRRRAISGVAGYDDGSWPRR